ncbi:hypothetical protein [Streptomyces megasporus]|uniref:hypothetical protein n=1 Tax=Streptomyces megasporus TaxID=44060 RepID=UPI0004E26100|nr:hypothetical protein [Streptomyces megasporus]
MPLHFLTVDGELDTAPSDTPLPYEDRERWRRPYRPGPWRVGGAALLLLLASYMLLSTLIIAMAGTLAEAVVCLVGAVLVIAYALRLLRLGVWVSAHGIRQVGLFSTTTLAWRNVAAVRTVQQPVKWLGMPRTVQGQALLVEPRGREALRTVLTDHNADFLARSEAFDRAADVVEAWAAEYRRPL